MIVLITVQKARSIVTRLRKIADELEEVVSREGETRDRSIQRSLVTEVRLEANSLEQCIR